MDVSQHKEEPYLHIHQLHLKLMGVPVKESIVGREKQELPLTRQYFAICSVMLLGD